MENQNKLLTTNQAEAINLFFKRINTIETMKVLNETFRSYLSDKQRIREFDPKDLAKDNTGASYVIEQVIVLLHTLENNKNNK